MLGGRRIWNSGFFRLAVVAAVVAAGVALVSAGPEKPRLTAAQRAAANRVRVRRVLQQYARVQAAELRTPAVRRERARLRAEQQPHFAAAFPGQGSRPGQHALVNALQRSITRDARARFARRQLDQQAHYTLCVHLVRPNVPHPPPPPLQAVQAGYECTAITNEVPASSRTDPAIIGYPFWARVNFRTGRYAWCKVNLLPSEPGIGDSLAYVPLAPICDVGGKGPA